MMNTAACLRTLCLAGFLFISATLCGRGAAAEAPTGRQTTDRDADLIAAMVDAGRTEAAEEICQRHLATAPPASASHAAWAIRLSTVRVAALQKAGSDDEQAWAAARAPVEQALSGYETEPAAPWLEFQRLLVGLSRSEQRAMRYLANPSDTSLQDALVDGLRAVIDGLRTLDARLTEMIPLADSGRLPGAAPPADLIQLQHSVRRRIVEALLLRGEAYPDGSEDALAAATEADGLAAALLEAGGTDAAAREAALRKWAETQRRLERPQAAVERISEWIATHGAAEPDTQAQLVLAALQSGDREAAEQWLNSFYGEAPAAAPSTLALDLARLRYLVAGETDTAERRQAVADWIARIEQRHGPYARRRAETEMLRVVQVRPSEGNATLLAARAGQLLRGGGEDQILQAAQLLSQASQIAGDTPEGFRWGLQAAAAMAKLGRHREAAQLFAAAAIRSPEQPQAAAAHFAAARQLSQQIAAQASAPQNASAQPGVSTAELTEQLQSLLEEQLRRWPAAAEATAARAWLVEIYEASRQYAKAAEVALRLPDDAVQWPEAVRHSGRFWRQALLAADSAEQRQQLAASSSAAWAAVPASHRMSAMQEANLIAAVALDRDTLRTEWHASAAEPPVGADPQGQEQPSSGPAGGFAGDLRRVRLEAIDPRSMALSARDAADFQTIIELSLLRLREDAREHPADAERMGRAMLRLVEGVGEGDSLKNHPLIADALALTGQWQKAAERWEQMAAGTPPQPDSLRQGAQLLGTLEDPAAVRRAVEMWNRLGQGLPKGSDAWHEAKLGAARALARIGQAEEAAKVARFVLLTQPPSDSALKAEYQRIAEGG